MFDSLPSVVLPFLVATAAVTDLHSYRIPNWLTGLTALAFLPVAVWSGMGVSDIGLHYLAGIILLIICFFLFQLGGFGGGDAKLIAACGVWFGMADAPTFLYASVMCGGGLAFAMLFWTLMKYIVQLDLGDFVPSLRKTMPKLPYGIALAAGTIMAMPESEWLTSLQQLS
jgi:prepilin peptidase CpaA